MTRREKREFERTHVRDLDLSEAYAFLWENAPLSDEDQKARDEYDARQEELELRYQEGRR